MFENSLPSCFVVGQLAFLAFRILLVVSGDFSHLLFLISGQNLATKKIDDKSFIGKHPFFTGFVCLQNAHERCLMFWMNTHHYLQYGRQNNLCSVTWAECLLKSACAILKCTQYQETHLLITWKKWLVDSYIYSGNASCLKTNPVDERDLSRMV